MTPEKESPLDQILALVPKLTVKEMKGLARWLNELTDVDTVPPGEAADRGSPSTERHVWMFKTRDEASG